MDMNVIQVKKIAALAEPGAHDRSPIAVATPAVAVSLSADRA